MEPGFVLTRRDPVLLSCVFCGSRRRAEFVASRRQRKYHPLCSSEVRKIHHENTVFFETGEDAEAAGYVPAG